MSEERFDRIDQALARLGDGQSHLQSRLDGVDGRLDGADGRFDGVDQRLERVDQRLERVDQRLERVDQRLEQVDRRFEQVDGRFEQVDRRLDGLRADMNSGFAEVRRYMCVLHEEALERIADTRELSAPTTSGRLAPSKDDIGRRLDPLEALVPVVREHDATLKKHDADIERLKRRR